MKKSEGAIKPISKNQKALFLYYIVDRYEAGISLQGTEVKSIRAHNVNLSEAYCRVQDDQLYIINLHIAPYEMGGYINHKPKRKRRLLMHAHEIVRLQAKLDERGFTLIPLSLYFQRGWVKVELGLAKGKKKQDKREHIKEREAKKEIRRHWR